MTKARYDIYLNTQATGIIHAMDCVVEEENALPLRVALRYTANFIEHPAAFPLDPIQLPLATRETTLNCQGGIPGIFDDYLPDAWGRKVLSQLAFYRHKKKLNANSLIDSLELIGGSRIGALSVVPQKNAPSFNLGVSTDELDKAENAAQQLDDIDFNTLNLDEMSLLYLANSGTGIGGARPKALVFENETNYIAKFNRLNRDDYNNARVEISCLQMAEVAGLNVGAGKIVSGINGREVLLLERFDVSTDQHRKHLVTANALLKEPNSQRDCGHVFRYDDICELLKRHSTAIETDLRQLLALMLFNSAINNTDDHERNFSFINDGEGYRLAPAYDMVPSLVTGQYHAAGFKHQPNPPRPSELISMGKIFGLPKTVIKEIVEQINESIGQWRKIAESNGVSEIEIKTIAKNFHL